VKLSVSRLIVKCLENEGVCCVFGLPGEENEDLLFSLAESPILFVPCRHEQGAAFMANVWGRLTGRAGVCLSTLGPGATNLITGIADANLDKAPLVAITAQAGRSRLHHESHQCLDIVNMFKPITKWNTALSTPDVVPEVVRKAFKVAEEEKPGATHFELSEDVASQPAAGNPDFKAYAESFGIRAFRPESVAELRRDLRAAITGGELSVVEIPVDKEVNADLLKKLSGYWAGVDDVPATVLLPAGSHPRA